MPPLYADRAVACLMRFLAVEGVTGQEKAIAAEVAQALNEAGVPGKSIRYDDANQRIPLPTQTGNLIVTLPGTRPGPRLLFMTHLDTVPLCAGALPVRASKDRIEAKGETALGGDNRTGVAALVTLAATLLEQKLPHPPLTLLFTVREESGLFGARHLNPADLVGVEMGFNIDGGIPDDMTIAAVGRGAAGRSRSPARRRMRACIRSSGTVPRRWSRALALARKFAVRRLVRQGARRAKPRGHVERRLLRRQVTAQEPLGEATNVVTDYVHIRGESRSRDAKFFKEITKAYAAAF